MPKSKEPLQLPHMPVGFHSRPACPEYLQKKTAAPTQYQVRIISLGICRSLCSHTPPQSSQDCSWFLKHWLNGKEKICADKYRSFSSIDGWIAAMQPAELQHVISLTRLCLTFQTWAGSGTPPSHSSSQAQLPPGKVGEERVGPPSLPNLRSWSKRNNSTIQFRFSLRNILIFWLNTSRKDIGLVLNSAGLLDLCI